MEPNKPEIPISVQPETEQDHTNPRDYCIREFPVRGLLSNEAVSLPSGISILSWSYQDQKNIFTE